MSFTNRKFLLVTTLLESNLYISKKWLLFVSDASFLNKTHERSFVKRSTGCLSSVCTLIIFYSLVCSCMRLWVSFTKKGSFLAWWYGQSPLMLWVRISIKARCTTLCDRVCQWLATGRWFSLGPPVTSTNKTDSHDTTEILLKVALNTIKQTN